MRLHAKRGFAPSSMKEEDVYRISSRFPFVAMHNRAKFGSDFKRGSGHIVMTYIFHSSIIYRKISP